MSILQKLIAQDWHPGKAALAGTLATVAYSVAMEGDKFLIGNYSLTTIHKSPDSPLEALRTSLAYGMTLPYR
jgi:hypothetical protein